METLNTQLNELLAQLNAQAAADPDNLDLALAVAQLEVGTVLLAQTRRATLAPVPTDMETIADPQRDNTMTQTERAVIYWAIRLVQTYHDTGSVDESHALTELLEGANELEQEQDVNLAYLHDRYV